MPLARTVTSTRKVCADRPRSSTGVQVGGPCAQGRLDDRCGRRGERPGAVDHGCRTVQCAVERGRIVGRRRPDLKLRKVAGQCAELVGVAAGQDRGHTPPVQQLGHDEASGVHVPPEAAWQRSELALVADPVDHHPVVRDLVADGEHRVLAAPVDTQWHQESPGHASVESGHGGAPDGEHTPGEPDLAKRFTSHSGRRPAARYGQQTRPRATQPVQVSGSISLAPAREWFDAFITCTGFPPPPPTDRTGPVREADAPDLRGSRPGRDRDRPGGPGRYAHTQVRCPGAPAGC